MDFFLKPDPVEMEAEIDIGNNVVLLGSCFSDSMKPKFDEFGFKCLSNPFGVLFHPLIVAELLDKVIKNEYSCPSLSRAGMYFSWLASSKLSENSKESLEKEFKTRLEILRTALLQKKTLLCITFGTAYAYRKIEDGRFTNK